MHNSVKWKLFMSSAHEVKLCTPTKLSFEPVKLGSLHFLSQGKDTAKPRHDKSRAIKKNKKIILAVAR